MGKACGKTAGRAERSAVRIRDVLAQKHRVAIAVEQIAQGRANPIDHELVARTGWSRQQGRAGQCARRTWPCISRRGIQRSAGLDLAHQLFHCHPRVGVQGGNRGLLGDPARQGILAPQPLDHRGGTRVVALAVRAQAPGVHHLEKGVPRADTLDHLAQSIRQCHRILIARARKGDAEALDAFGQVAAFDFFRLGRHGPAVVFQEEEHREIPPGGEPQGFVERAFPQRPIAKNRDGNPGLTLLAQGPGKPGGQRSRFPLHAGREEATAPQVLGAAATAAKRALSPQQLSQERIGRTASGQVVPVTPVGGEQRVPINVQMAGQRNGHQLLSQAGVHGPCQAAAREESEADAPRRRE